MSGQPTLRRKLLRDIRRTWTLFAALVVAVALGLGMYAAMNNSYLNLQESYDYAFSEQGFPDLFVTIPDAQGYADQVRRDLRGGACANPGPGRPADDGEQERG